MASTRRSRKKTQDDSAFHARFVLVSSDFDILFCQTAMVFVLPGTRFRSSTGDCETGDSDCAKQTCDFCSLYITDCSAGQISASRRSNPSGRRHCSCLLSQKTGIGPIMHSIDRSCVRLRFLVVLTLNRDAYSLQTYSDPYLLRPNNRLPEVRFHFNRPIRL